MRDAASIPSITNENHNFIRHKSKSTESREAKALQLGLGIALCTRLPPRPHNNTHCGLTAVAGLFGRAYPWQVFTRQRCPGVIIGDSE